MAVILHSIEKFGLAKLAGYNIATILVEKL